MLTIMPITRSQCYNDQSVHVHRFVILYSNFPLLNKTNMTNTPTTNTKIYKLKHPQVKELVLHQSNQNITWNSLQCPLWNKCAPLALFSLHSLFGNLPLIIHISYAHNSRLPNTCVLHFQHSGIQTYSYFIESDHHTT